MVRNKQVNVKACTCKHADQDKTYGKGKRVHNETVADPKTYRCTVCLTVRS